jgi:hypothetical protein
LCKTSQSIPSSIFCYSGRRPEPNRPEEYLNLSLASKCITADADLVPCFLEYFDSFNASLYIFYFLCRIIDRLYYHITCNCAGIKGKSETPGVHTSVVLQSYFTGNWLVLHSYFARPSVVLYSYFTCTSLVLQKFLN